MIQKLNMTYYSITVGSVKYEIVAENSFELVLINIMWLNNVRIV